MLEPCKQMLSVQNTVITTNFDQKKRISFRKHLMTINLVYRIRKEKIAIVANIQNMFHSFLVNEDHRDYLCFLWHVENDFEKPLVTYRMEVHVFGNRSSPSVAMYGLCRIGDLTAETHEQEVKEFTVNDFYADDGLKSCATTHEAIDLLKNTARYERVW